jgi:predicted amidohydrolase
VALLQTRIAQGETEENWRRAELLFARAMDREPALVVLPEAFATGVNFIILRQMAEPVPGGRTCERLRALAAEHGVHVAAGVLEAGEDGRVYDSALVISPLGEVLGKYRRRFLWVGERSYVSAGDGPVVVPTGAGRIGLLVGYDLCFPEACATFLGQEVDLAVCTASVFQRLNFSASRLGLARAMDHHCYFAYANAVGFHPFANMRYTGGSAVFADPYFLQVELGDEAHDALGCLARAGAEDEEVLVADLHLEALARARRSKLPFRADAAFTLERAPTESLAAGRA